MANHCSAAGELADRLGTARRGPRRYRAVVRALGREGRARRPGRRRAHAHGADLARRRGVRGVPPHRRRRRRGRDGPFAQRHALRPADRRRGVRGSASSCSTGSTSTRSTRSLDAEPVERPPLSDDGARRRVSRRSATSATCAARTSPATAAARPTWSRPRPRCCRSRRPRRRSPAGPRSCTTSAASACPDRCGTSPGRSAPPTTNACVCTCTTSSGSSTGPNRCAGSGCSPRHTTSAWTARAITAASAPRCSRRRPGCSPRPTRTTR